MSNDLSPAYAHVSQDTKRSRLLPESISSRKQPAETQEYLKEMIMTEISRQSSDAHHWSAMPVPALIVGSGYMVGAFLKQDGGSLDSYEQRLGIDDLRGDKLSSCAPASLLLPFPRRAPQRSGLSAIQISLLDNHHSILPTVYILILTLPVPTGTTFQQVQNSRKSRRRGKKKIGGNFLFVLFFFCGSFWNNVKCISWHAPQN